MTKVKTFYIESELVFAEKPNGFCFQDLTGQKFNRLTILGFAGQNKAKQSLWYCCCECKKLVKVAASDLKTGHTTSCGCFLIERATVANTTHGHNKKGGPSQTYRVWQNMLNRCQNPKTPRFKDYGNRGITVCKRWQSFENFLSDMGERPKGLTLERIENDKGYYLENCRWATRTEQANNTRANVFLTFNGKTQTIAQWAEEKGIKYETLRRRIVKLGWSIEKAITTMTEIKYRRFEAAQKLFG